MNSNFNHKMILFNKIASTLNKTEATYILANSCFFSRQT